MSNSGSPPPTDKEKLKELFQKLDINKDGRLELSEIREALHHQGITTPGEAEVSTGPFSTCLTAPEKFYWLKMHCMCLCVMG